MNPYVRPGEKKVGASRPKIQHVAEDPLVGRTRAEREADKQGVAAERRALKKSARRHLREQLIAELEDST
jgi:hypothetical protein